MSETLIMDAWETSDPANRRCITVADPKGIGGKNGRVHLLIGDGPQGENVAKGIILDEEGSEQLVEAICALLGVHVSPDGWERELQ